MRFRCNVCGSFPVGFVFEADKGECPKCGVSGPPYVAQLIDVHFVCMDARGPIGGSKGRQFVACEPKRPYLCLSPEQPYSATDDPRAVTCPSCKGTKQYKEMAALYEELRASLQPPAVAFVDCKT